MNALCQIAGLGTYVPKEILSNQDLENMMDTSDEWIFTRTGIKERRILATSENASDAGFYAAQKAIEDAKIEAKDITHIFVASCTPDYLSPSVSCLIAQRLGLAEYSGVTKISIDSQSITCLDFNAACSGFVYGLEMARAYLALHENAVVLLVAAEAMSRRMNYEDRTTSVLFGDGAGAVIIKNNCEHPLFTLHDVSCGADGDLSDLIQIGGGSKMNAKVGDKIDESFFLTMQGRDVFKNAVRGMVQESQKVLERNNLTVNDIDLFIAHQANARILEAVASRLEIPEEKVFMNVSLYGNTSASSIPLALENARQQNLIKKGEKTLLTAFGAGLTWASALLS